MLVCLQEELGILRALVVNGSELETKIRNEEYEVEL